MNKLEKTIKFKNDISSIRLDKLILSKYFKTYEHPFIIIKINQKTLINLSYEDNKTEQIDNILCILDIFEKQNNMLFYNTEDNNQLELDNIKEINLSIHNHEGNIIIFNDKNNKNDKNDKNDKNKLDGFIVLSYN